MYIYIKVGSITNAQRAKAILNSRGFKPQIKRVENPTKNDGCGYAIEVYAKNDAPVNLIKKAGINIRGVEYNDIP